MASAPTFSRISIMHSSGCARTQIDHLTAPTDRPHRIMAMDQPPLRFRHLIEQAGGVGAKPEDVVVVRASPIGRAAFAKRPASDDDEDETLGQLGEI